MEGISELKIASNYHAEWHYQAEEGQRQAEQEGKDMAGKFAQAMLDRSFVKDLLLAEQERSDDLAHKLQVLQEQRRTTEKI